MTNYIIPVFGQCTVSDECWKFAFQCLGYAMPSIRHLTVSKPTKINATSKKGPAYVVVGNLDEVLVIRTDAPEKTLCAFWAITTDTCGFIGVLDGNPIKTIDDVIENGEIRCIH